MSREVPEGWCAGKFWRFITLQRGFDLPVHDRQQGAFAVIASNGQIDCHTEPRVSGPAVVTGRSGTLGKVFYVEEGCWPLNTTLYVKDFHGNDPEFVACFLQHFKLDRFGTGTGVPTLNRNVVHEEDVILPPLPEQRRIAEILSSVDEAIAATRAVIEQTRKVKQAVLERLLTKGIGHTRFKQTEIGEIPEGWEVMQLRDLATQITSGSRGWARYYSEEGDLFLRSQNVRSGALNLSDKQFVKVSKSAEGSRTLVAAGDIVFTITGNSVGNVASIPPSLGDAYVSQHVALVRLKDPAISSFLVAFFSPSGPGNQQIMSSQYGQSKPGLSLENVRTFHVPIPSKAELAQLDRIISDYTGYESRLAEELRQLEATKSALMSDLLTGRKRVTDALPLAAE